MGSSIQTLGIIAGNGSLPLALARHARAEGMGRLVAVAFYGETNPALADWVDDIVWIRVGQLNRLIQTLAKRGVKYCVMVGQVAPSNLFELRPDWRGCSVLFRLRERNAHTVFGAIGEELAADGITLVEPTPWLKPLMPGSGYHLGRKLTPQQQEDVDFGYRIAKEIARLEIGQSVVVKQGTVLAVEGFEGTDACLERGGRLAGSSGGAVAVKVAKEGHDMRFDIPCVGTKTLETCGLAGIDILAIQANKTLLLDFEQWPPLLKKHRLSVVTVG